MILIILFKLAVIRQNDFARPAERKEHVCSDFAAETRERFAFHRVRRRIVRQGNHPYFIVAHPVVCRQRFDFGMNRHFSVQTQILRHARANPCDRRCKLHGFGLDGQIQSRFVFILFDRRVAHADFGRNTAEIVARDGLRGKRIRFVFGFQL